MAVPLANGAHERRVARRLEARGLPGLGEALVKLRGFEIGRRWRVDSLYAVGAEGAVYLASDLRDPSVSQHVVKIPVVPLNRPVELSSGLLRHRRESLVAEARHLASSASPYMPASHGLFEFANPLLDHRRGGAFADPDPALVMERLPGLDADLWLARVHASDLPRPLLRRHLDRLVVVLLQALHDLQERGFFYADLRPGNLRVIGRPERRVRLLDAGSLVEVGDASGRFPHVPHYLPPELFARRYGENLPIVPSAAVQAVMAGRTLFEVATGSVPVPGERIDSAALKDAGVSPPVADVVDGLATGSFSSVVPALRYLSRRAVRRGPCTVPPELASLPAHELFQRTLPVDEAATAPPPQPSPPAPATAFPSASPPDRVPEPEPVLAAAPAVSAPPGPQADRPPRRRRWWRRLLDAFLPTRRAGAAGGDGVATTLVPRPESVDRRGPSAEFSHPAAGTRVR